MTAINQIVNVNAFYFKNNKADQQLRSYPRSVEFGNTTISFQDGLQYLIHKGQHIVRLFDMTDGRTTFRLKLEDNQWTLVGTQAGARS
jgi:hypothetical protein